MKYLIIILLLISANIASAETVDKIVAKVGTEVIMMSDVTIAIAQQKNFLIQNLGRQKGMAEFLKFKKNVLNEMILQIILGSQIKNEGIEVSDPEIDQEYRARLSRYGMNEQILDRQLRKEGISLLEFKKSIRKELERQKFVQKKIMPTVTISDYDLQKEYQANIKKFQVYSKMRFIEVFLTIDKFSDEAQMSRVANQIQAQLKRGASASALIAKYSSGAFANRGGNSGLVDATQLRPEIQAILSKLKIGQTSQVFPFQNSIFIFKLLSKSDPKPIPFGKVINQIRGRYGDKVVQEELKKYLMAVRDQTYVEIVR